MQRLGNLPLRAIRPLSSTTIGGRTIKLPSILYASTTASSVSSREFAFPEGTVFKARSPRDAQEKSSEYATALSDHGILSVDLAFEDPSSSFILDVVNAIGCTAQSHSSKDGPLWDITWKPEGTVKDPKGKPTKGVWSHSMDEMSWHTDGSFEHHPMPFFGFHILRSDHHGGGQFRILKADEIANKLSPEAWQILTTKEFDLRVPPEFMKTSGSVKGKLVRVDPDTGRIHLRYRSSVIKNPPSDDSKANEAVAELQSLLHGKQEDIGQTVSPLIFSDNSILLMDNARFLHSRTNVADKKRWLRRVRFEGVPNPDN